MKTPFEIVGEQMDILYRAGYETAKKNSKKHSSVDDNHDCKIFNDPDGHCDHPSHKEI